MVEQKKINKDGKWGYKCPTCKEFVETCDAWFYKGKQKHYNCLPKYYKCKINAN